VAVAAGNRVAALAAAGTGDRASPSVGAPAMAPSQGVRVTAAALLRRPRRSSPPSHGVVGRGVATASGRRVGAVAVAEAGARGRRGWGRGTTVRHVRRCGGGGGGEVGRRGRRREAARPPCCRWALDHVLAARRRRIGGAARRRIDVVMVAMALVSASVARAYRALRRVQVSRPRRAYVGAPRRGRACACDVSSVGGRARGSDADTVAVEHAAAQKSDERHCT